MNETALSRVGVGEYGKEMGEAAPKESVVVARFLRETRWSVHLIVLSGCAAGLTYQGNRVPRNNPLVGNHLQPF